MKKLLLFSVLALVLAGCSKNSDVVYDLGTGQSSFKMSTGIICQVNMLKKEASKEYSPLVIDLPESLYTAIGTMNKDGQDNMAYFISSGLMKCYAGYNLQKGTESTNLWFDKTGAESTKESDNAINVFLELEAGNPTVGGGKYVKVHFDQKVGADLKINDNIKCTLLFDYDKTATIPMTCFIKIVDKLE